MTMSCDIETQINGAVGVIYAIDKSSDVVKRYDKTSTWQRSNLLKALPFRFEAIHYCYDSILWLPSISVIQFGLQLFTRLRFRSHYGTYVLFLLSFCFLFFGGVMVSNISSFLSFLLSFDARTHTRTHTRTHAYDIIYIYIYTYKVPTMNV